jgi:hypothetical protein
MVLKKHSKRTRQSKPSLVALLREQLIAANEREKELLRQLALKDAQIQMVLEDQFFKPVFAKAAEPEKANTAIHGEDLTDSVQFPTKGDADAIEKEEKAAAEAREKFQQELDELTDEQEAAHVEDEVPAETLADA